MTVPVGDWPRLPSPVRRVLSRVGRRGAYLIVFGLVFILLAAEPFESTPAFAYAEALMPLAWWRATFGVCGIIAVAAGSLLPPPKAIGFAALQFAALSWGGSILAAVLDPTVTDAGRGGLLWLLVAASTQIVSRLVEPSDLAALAAHSTAGDHTAGDVRPGALQLLRKRGRRGR